MGLLAPPFLVAGTLPKVTLLCPPWEGWPPRPTLEGATPQRRETLLLTLGPAGRAMLSEGPGGPGGGCCRTSPGWAGAAAAPVPPLSKWAFSGSFGAWQGAGSILKGGSGTHLGPDGVELTRVGLWGGQGEFGFRSGSTSVEELKCFDGREGWQINKKTYQERSEGLCGGQFTH